MVLLGAPSPDSSCLNRTGSREIDAELSVFDSRRLAYRDIPPRAGGGGADISAGLFAAPRLVLIVRKYSGRLLYFLSSLFRNTTNCKKVVGLRAHPILKTSKFNGDLTR